MTDPDARLLAYADGELTPAAAAEVERELVAQPDLRERLDELRRFHERLRGGLPAAPAYNAAQRQTFADRLAFAAGAARTRRHWRRVRVAAAACLLVGVSGLLAVPAVRGMRVVESKSTAGDMPAIRKVGLAPIENTIDGLGRDPRQWRLSGQAAPIDTQHAATRPLELHPREVGTGSATYDFLDLPSEGQNAHTDEQFSMETDQENPKGRDAVPAHTDPDPRELMRTKSLRQDAAKRTAAVESVGKDADRRKLDVENDQPGRGRSDLKVDSAKEEILEGKQVVLANDEISSRAAGMSIVTNPWTLVERDARSTFALDTDRASYAFARRHLDAGTLPPPVTVRVEEFVNAFDYHDHAPEVDAFALRAEAAPAPFCQGATLLRLGLKGRIAGRDGRRPAHLVLVVDASGSMDRPDRAAVAKAGLLAVLGALAPADRVTLIAFNAEARLLAEALPANDPALRRAFDAIPAQGASNLAAGLGLGYAQAARGYRPGAVNRVVLVSDGIANLGETGLEELVAAAETNRRQGIATTTVGVGAGSYDDALLARLAKRGDGHYLRLDEDVESRAAFVADLGAGLQTIAADAKIQVAFDPARVRRWRLLGYEQRALAHQDFANDAVDAGEVGSGQAATALYELELIGDAGTDLGSVQVRYRDPADGAVHERAWRLAGDLSRPRSVAEAPAFHLAAAAAEFAELLRGSEHAADGSFSALIAVLERVAAVWPHDAAVADLLRLARAAPGLPPAP